jgi:hypothetical protein
MKRNLAIFFVASGVMFWLLLAIVGGVALLDHFDPSPKPSAHAKLDFT